ncbi:MAG: leucine-rich repeat protein, partial [Verrucomicrobia bacterium]|nr:leucine-rich repeat protein [Verrucomicrobiota bacterium]
EIYSVTAIGEAAFKDNTTLTHVLIPNSVTSIGSEAFRGCTNLQEMIMPNSVTRINWAAFMDCANLGNLVISENCTYISGSAFERCYALTDLYIPDSVTQIDGSTFRSCNGLIQVTIGNGLTSIDGYVFDLCSNLERVELGTGVNTIQDRAFGGCSKLTKVTFAGNAPASCSGSAFADAPATLYYITGTTGWTDPWNGMPTVAVDLDTPVIITQPASQVVMTEDSVSFTVAAIGSAGLIYQWYKDGSAIKGATDSIYTIDSVQMADAGSYAVTVSNGVNSVTSEEAILTVIDSTPTGDPAEDFAYTISGGVVTITGYLGSNEVVTIPNIIERCFVRTLGSASFRANNLIKKVVIPDTVKTIEGRVFLDSQSLESVEIGEGVETIGSWAFAGCVKLKTMVIPDSVTRTDGAFFNNPGLTSIIIGSNVTNFGDTFGLCGNLKSIYFKGNAPVANNIEANATVYYFSGTTGWTDPWCGRPAVEIDGILITEQPQSEILLEGDTVTFSTAVVGIGDLSYQWYKDGEAIKGATGSSYTIDSVQMADAGSYAVTVSNGVNSVTSEEATLTVIDSTPIGDPAEDFEYTISGDEVTITGYLGSNEVVTIPNIIEGCLVRTLGSSLFRYNKTITEVVVPNTVRTMGDWVFADCVNLSNVTIPNSVTVIGEHPFIRCNSLIEVTLPDSLTSIGYGAFDSCASLETVYIGNNVTAIEAYAFYNCRNLTAIELPAKVASIGSYAFNSCNSLTSIEVSDDNTTYSSVDGVLFNKDQTKLILCPAGKAGEFNIPNGTLSIEGSAFKSCIQLTVVTIPDTVTSIGNEAFRSCTSLQEMIIPDSVTEINWAAFMDCASLQNLVISENCTYISGSSFERCYALTEVYIPDSVTQIDGSTFRNCSGLLRVVIGNGLTSIDGYVFDCCSNLEWVEVGSGVNTIQDRAFGSCTNLTVVYFTGNAPETCSDSAFDDAPATLYYMAGAEGWTDPWYGMPTVEVDGLAITVQPQSQIALEDFTITFSVTAIGVGELSYQWYKDGEVIAGATASSYTIDSVQMADAGSYAAVVSNADKSVTSDEATLIVREPPSGTEGLEYTYNADGTAIVTGIGTATEEANIIIPEIVVKDGVIYTVTGIKNYTSFCWSDSFVSVSIPAGMTSIGTGAFRGCSNLTDIFVDPDNPNYTSVDGILFNKDQTVLVQYPCGREGEYVVPADVTEIGEMAFYYCSKLSSVTLNDGLETISNLAFYNCGIQPGIVIPDSVTTIGSS